MPLDDRERFGRWRDLFIGKCFTGFGSAIGMRLYLVVCQMIMGGSIRFTDAKIVSSIEIDYFMKIIYLEIFEKMFIKENELLLTEKYKKYNLLYFFPELNKGGW